MNNVKKIFAVIFAAMAVMLMNTAVFAYSGSGTEDDPCIIMDYKEFADLSRENISTSPTPKEKWYKLGCDISAEDNSNSTYAILIGNHIDYESYMHLDLAGYTMSRKALTTDPGMFWLQAGKLFIEDSEGTGKIECQIGITNTPKITADTGAIFYLKSNHEFYSRTELIINGGTFSTPDSKYSCIKAYSANGTIRINDGTFVNGAVETAVDANYNGKTKTYIKGGTFSKLTLSDLGETRIYDCIVNGKIFSSNSKLNYMIPSNSTITCNGSVVTDRDVQGIEGYIVITSPDRHTITYQANGADGEMTAVRAYTGDTFTFPECKFTAPTGHYFNKWLYNGNYYSVGDTLTVSGDMTVIAQWEPRQYIVSFNTGGVYTEHDQIVKYGEKASKPAAPYCYNEMYINNWYTDREYTTRFNFNTAITQNTILYAKWEPLTDLIGRPLINEGEVQYVYYGNEITLQTSSAASVTSTEWKVSLDGANIASSTTTKCVIPEKAVPAGQTATVVLAKTTKSGVRPVTTYTTMYLTYVYKQGDIDGDGGVNSVDAAKLLKHISGTENLSADILKRAEMDYNSEIDMRDVILILQKTEAA